MLSGRKKALPKNSGSALSHVVVQMSGGERITRALLYIPVGSIMFPGIP
jgi:hypothetical protein